MLSCDKDKKSGNAESEDSVEPKGDSEMAPVYLKRMLPVFCNTFQSTMLPSIRYIFLSFNYAVIFIFILRILIKCLLFSSIENLV